MEFTPEYISTLEKIGVGACADVYKYGNKALKILKERGIIKKQLDGVKVLANGTLTKKLTVKADRFSSVAVTKIENAGGKTEVI